jgi:hypothetical protein
MSVAEEKGLNAAGVKEVARDVADTFGKSFSGDQQQGNRTDQKQSATASGGGSQSGAGTMRSASSAGAASSSAGATPSGPGTMRTGASGASTQSTSKSGSQPSQSFESKTPPQRTKGG